MKFFLLIIGILLLFSCAQQKQNSRSTIDLSGTWSFAIDSTNSGVEDHWYSIALTDEIQLPGTMDTNHKGNKNNDTTTMHLNRLYTYEGPAWYQKKITIPENFINKHIELSLERTKSSTVWIDSIKIGSSPLLQSPQKFDLSQWLTPGEHTLTIRIDNNLKLTPYGNVHIYSDDTQTNWNGILGKIFIEASPVTHINDLQVYPDIENKKIDIQLAISNPTNQNEFEIQLLVEKTSNGKTEKLKTKTIKVAYNSVINLEYELGNKCELWDEYSQPLYRLTATLVGNSEPDTYSVPFGMRKFETKETQFSINGRTIFLRGKHEAAVFPLTGYPPMDVDGWKRVYRIAKSYGINHYRFHSYCPPEAAFTAADEEGIYLQAELPFWGGLDSITTAIMLRLEGYAMLKTYANHPSFVMLSHGNEIWSGHDKVEENILALKEFDNRVLYTMGSNNNIGFVAPRPCSDFFVGARTPSNGDTTLTHTRLTHAFADSYHGGILNTQIPSTEINFNYAVNHIDIPIMSHEIGQYQIYPDYTEIEKYTGVLQARNLEVFRDRLKEKGMAHLDSAFQKASGAWSALCYKAEMEAAIRTKGMAGFQLLDLQDFPGQGTALVGILDAFMESKGVITPEAWKQSCNDVVILVEFPKYCWTTDETFQARIAVANYSNQTINKTVKWELNSADGTVISEGSSDSNSINNQGIQELGNISVDLSKITKPEKLLLTASIPSSEYRNEYPIWVYPAQQTIETEDDIIETEELSDAVIAKLQNGAKVLLFPKTNDVKDKSYSGHFPPEFWNYGMFKGISEWAKKPVSPGTLGLLMNPDHPIFNQFPTDFHTNWQWFSIIKASNSLIMDDTPTDYYPIVQVIDNLERNNKLGLIFEFQVGQGKLLVCMSQLQNLNDKPEAVQLHRSILNYMKSNQFNPQQPIDISSLNKLL